MFQILVFYKDEDALQRYIEPFLHTDKPMRVRKEIDRSIYEGQYTLITCIRNLSDYSARGRRASIVAVQEELTWCDNWPEIRDCVVRPLITSPIDIQIFDGVTPEEAAYHERNNEI